MAVFVFAATHLEDDPHLANYWPDGTSCLLPFCKRFQLSKLSPPAAARARPAVQAQTQPGEASAMPKRAAAEASRLRPVSNGRPPVPPTPRDTVVLPRSPAVARPLLRDDAPTSRGAGSSAGDSGGGAGSSSSSNSANGRIASYAGAALAGIGASHLAAPVARSAGGAAAPAAAPVVGPAVVVGYEVDDCSEQPLHWPAFPRRPGQQACEFYTKTGTCKYAQGCVFDHPDEYAVPLTEQQLPYRQGEPVCAFYLKTNQCKFGAACKFHHPKLRPIFAGSTTAAASGGG